MNAAAYDFLIFLAVCVVAAVVAWLIYRARRKRGDAAYLLSLWGSPPGRAFKPAEMVNIRDLAALIQPCTDTDIDDITWNDLEMDALYSRINGCLSGAGDEALYSILRTPDEAALPHRLEMLEWARQNKAEREAVKAVLYGVGRRDGVDMRLLLEDNPFRRSGKILALLLCAGLAASIVLTACGFVYAAFGIAAFATVNFIYSYIRRREHAKYINTIGYAVAIVNGLYKIAGRIPGLPAVNRKKLNDHLAVTAKIRKNAILELFYTDDSIILFINQLFLLETIAFRSIVEQIQKHADIILELYKLAGLLDAMIAVASWRETLGFYCEPEFTQERALHFDGMAHPLVKNAVPNSLDTRRSILLTGSNATGKSTFIKMIAVNAILAQTVGTCTAGSWRAPFFRVMTSMALRDNICADESYFITEIKSLRRMLDHIAGGPPCLFLIDEVLRGTNTGERIAASAEVLRLFAQSNCICIAATHDIELSHILEPAYRNMHFTETLRGRQMTFDYKIKEGRSASRNALRLLEQMGYGDRLARAAARRLDHFNETGSWDEPPNP